MFSILLYYCHTENNRMDKSDYIDLIARITGNLRESTSLINPTITIELNDQIMQGLISSKEIVVDSDDVLVETQNYTPIIIKYRKKVLSANYVYIPQFDRYYFVDNVVCVTSTLWQLDLSVDVLMSFKEQLGELDVFCERSEFNYDNMLIDEKVPSDNKHIVDRYIPPISPFKSVFTQKQFDDFRIILSVAGYKPLDNYANKSDMTVPYVKYYAVNLAALDGFSSQLFLGTTSLLNLVNYYLVNPSDCLRSATIYPFDAIGAFGLDSPDTSESVDKIMISNRELEIPNHTFLNLLTNVKAGRIGFDITVPEHYHNFLDYEPFTQVYLVLPFVGVIELPTDRVMGTIIEVIYECDIETGAATVCVYSDGHKLVYKNSCQLGYQLPTIKTNISDQLRGITSSMITMASGAIMGGFQGAAMAASGLAQGLNSRASYLNAEHKTPTMRKAQQAEQRAIKKETASDLVDLTTNYVSKNSIILMNSLKGTAISGQAGNNVATESVFIGNRNEIQLIVVRPNARFPIGYNHLVGRPSKYTGKLKNLKGYTELGGFHLEGLYNCTKTEQEAINGILRSGFLMPDP